MHKCNQVRKTNEYVDNLLNEKARLDFEEHLKSCPDCSGELSRLKELSGQLKAWAAPEAGQGFEGAVRNKIVAWELERGDEKMKAKPWVILIPSGVLAGILLFVVLGSFYSRPQQMLALKRAVGDRRQYEPYAAVGGSKPDDGKVLNKEGNEKVLYGQNFRQNLLYDNSGYIEHSYRTGEQSWGSGSATEASESYSKIGAAKSMPVESELQFLGEGPVIVIQPVLPATGEGDKIIRTAEVRIEVEDGNQAYKKVSALCEELGGYLATSNFYKDNEGREAGTITMRIPKDKFLLALEKIGQLGKVETSQTNSQDVGQQYANLKSRLDASMVVYKKMMEALQKKQVTIPEAVRLESELTPVLQRIEELKNAIETLNNSVSFTTISVYFHEPAISAKVFKESNRYIKEGMLRAQINAVRFVAGAIPLIPGILILVVAAIAIAFVLKAVMRKK